MQTLLCRLIRDEDGQDLVEYALLMAFLGITFLAVWNSVTAALASKYGATTSGVQTLWSTPDPGGSPP